MLSAQHDKLRWLADNLEEHDSHMDEYVQAMRSAADIIWQLRNDCVDLRDENAKLRERVAELDELLPENGRWFSAEIVEAYVAEIAKLRELAKAAWGCVKRQVSCDECRMVCCGCTLQSAMHELGIEVNNK